MEQFALSEAESIWARVQVLLSRGDLKRALALALEEEARTTYGPEEARSFGSVVIMPLEWFPPGWALFVPGGPYVLMQMDIVDEFYASDVMWNFADRLEAARKPALRRFDARAWRTSEDGPA